MTASASVIGTSVPRIEGPEKVTGRARYAADVLLPGMLWGKILRSPRPHARIRSIEASKSWSVPGVRAVVTGQDVPGHYIGKILRDMPVLCWDRVRYIGDRVAAVAAETPEAAEEALGLIEVDYVDLPAVFDPLEALKPEAPLIHDDAAAYDGMPQKIVATDVHNGQTRLSYGKGDVEQGFRESDLIFEHTFHIPSRHQGYLEPYASVVGIGEDGRVQAWCSSKAPFRARIQLSKAVGIPEEQIRVNVTYVGGDFGGKGDARDLPIAYFLAKQAGRPVKIVMTFAEELSASNPTHPTVITIKSGVMRDGRIVARQIRAVHASGAYGALKPNASLSSWHYSGGAYRVDHADIQYLQVYTNTVPGGYFRAPGGHQYAFAVESHTDLIAKELGMDPAEFRLKNMLQEGDVDACGTKLRGIKAKEALEAAMKAIGWGSPMSGPNRGRGIGMFGRQIGGGPGAAILTAEEDGSFTVLSPTFDVGTGTHTIVQQIVANEMHVPVDDVDVETGDTDTAPFDEGPRASRVTYCEGTAVLKACAELRRRLDAAELLPITVTVQEDVPQPGDVMYFCAQIAEVEVDPETGETTVKRVVTAHDVGTIINPVTHQGQINGGFVTGYGLAVTEEFISNEGRVLNAHLGDYKLPSIADLPELETVLVPSAGGTGPYEAKAIGELANNPTAAAIANAVAAASGARVFALPVTAERVYAALHGDGSEEPKRLSGPF
ncbi:MAG TPA: xanthine dehydrogenase family protein molybdopterin-binding subunit [Dehalococcoidia bacterium]|nr:xanthine dehydrogenase family protein molybdopterin-binding subunit [Dehalococcoidia bacterium]